MDTEDGRAGREDRRAGREDGRAEREDGRAGREDGRGWATRAALGVARGVAMGAADVVPGVSGGTIAVVLGIYERLLDAVRGTAGAAAMLLRGDWRDARRRLGAVDWLFVAPLLVGIGTTVVLAAPLIEAQLRQRPQEMAGLFCGLVAGSTVAACRLFEWRNGRRLALSAAVAGITFAGLGLQSGPVADPSLPVLAGAGAVAVCAMILPGISGAFLMVMLGMYAAVLSLVTDTRFLDAAVFAAGAAVGLAVFSSLLSRLLKRARHTVMAMLVGLMAGSLRVLWPWPNGVGVISRHEDEAVSGAVLGWPGAHEWLAPTVAAAVGFVGLLVIAAVARE